MASILFERGNSTSTAKPKVDGKITYLKDKSELYFDVGTSRKEINANNAKTVGGASFSTELNYNSMSFPSSESIIDYSNEKIKMQISDNSETLFLFTPKVITFGVNGYEFKCENQMTWKQWKLSPFYDNRIKIDGNIFWQYAGDSYYLISSENENDVIIENYHYTSPSHHGGTPEPT